MQFRKAVQRRIPSKELLEHRTEQEGIAAIERLFITAQLNLNAAGVAEWPTGLNSAHDGCVADILYAVDLPQARVMVAWAKQPQQLAEHGATSDVVIDKRGVIGC